MSQAQSTTASLVCRLSRYTPRIHATKNIISKKGGVKKSEIGKCILYSKTSSAACRVIHVMELMFISYRAGQIRLARKSFRKSIKNG